MYIQYMYIYCAIFCATHWRYSNEQDSSHKVKKSNKRNFLGYSRTYLNYILLFVVDIINYFFVQNIVKV